MAAQHDSVFITGYARTPIGNFRGCLSSLNAAQLGAIAIHAAINRVGLDNSRVDEVLMGCVLPAGLGQAPARQAALEAGLPLSVGSTTVNKMCGSGMKAVMLGVDLIKAGSAKVVVAGGMESMSNAPYLLPDARNGLPMGSTKLLDHMLVDGLEDPAEKRLMGCYAEDCAEKYHITREQQDAFARASLSRALKAIRNKLFQREIVPATVLNGNETIVFQQDEIPGAVNIERIGQLKPVFKTSGTVTAANSSKISDGAAAVVLMAGSELAKHRIKPLARISGHHTHAQHPAWFTTAPIDAMKDLLDKLALGMTDIDLFEINEAFAVVALAAIGELALPAAKVNVHGGACALGHPIGASGARILVTLLSALEHYDLKRGLAAICIGGGEATAMVIER